MWNITVDCDFWVVTYSDFQITQTTGHCSLTLFGRAGIFTCVKPILIDCTVKRVRGRALQDRRLIVRSMPEKTAGR